MFIRNCISKYIGVVYFLFNDIFQEKKKTPIHYRANVQKRTLFISVKISLVLWTIIATTQSGLCMRRKCTDPTTCAISYCPWITCLLVAPGEILVEDLPTAHCMDGQLSWDQLQGYKFFYNETCCSCNSVVRCILHGESTQMQVGKLLSP